VNEVKPKLGNEVWRVNGLPQNLFDRLGKWMNSNQY